MKRIRFMCCVVALAAGVGTIVQGFAYGGHNWAVRQIPYYINPANYDMSTAAATAAIQAAANAWSSQTNSDVTFYYMGPTTGTTLQNNGKNEIFFRYDTSTSLAETYRWWDGTGHLVDADTVFHDASTLFVAGNTGCTTPGYYLQNVATHELGHALGLDHSSVTTATMYPGENPCTTWKESLDPDDLAAVEYVYPPAGTTNTAPSVTISAPGNGLSFTSGIAVTFSASATDSQDGNISSRIVWKANGTQFGTGASVAKALPLGTNTVTASVTDSGGLTSTKQITVYVVASTNTAPAIAISSPVSGTSVTFNTSVTFTGAATDSQDGNISSKIVWKSNGTQFGVGGTVVKALPLGTNAVTASVTDTGGLTSTKQITVSVTSATSTNICSSVTLSRTVYYSGAGSANWPVTVTAPNSTCTWTATIDQSWILLNGKAGPTSISGVGSMMLKIGTVPNPTAAMRYGHFTIAGTTYKVTQEY